MKTQFFRFGPVWLVLLAALLDFAGCSRRNSPEKLLASADKYYDARQFEKAKVEYFNVLRRQPTNSRAILRLGKVYFRQGQIEEAAPFLSEAKKRFPADLEVSEKLAIILQGIGQLELARTEALVVLARQPTNEIALGVFSGCMRTPKDGENVLKQLAQWQEQVGDRAAFHVVRAQVASRQKNTNLVESELQAALSREPLSVMANQTLGVFRWSQGATNEAEKAFRTAAKAAPADHDARIALVSFLLGTGRIEEAKTALDEINKDAPERTVAWVMRASLALNESKLDECGRLLERALGQTPNDFRAGLLQAQLRMAQKKPAEAVKILKASTQRRPKSGELQYQLAQAQMANQEVKDAAASLTKAAALETNNVTIAVMLAELNLNRGEPEAAVTALADLTRRQPNQEQAQLLLGRAYLAAGRMDDAIRTYRAMQTRFPKNPIVPHQLGLLLRQRRDGAVEARKHFEEARRLSPNSFEPLEQLITLELAAKQPQKALALLQPELDRNPKSAPLWLLRAQVYNAERNFDGTKTALEKAIELQPEFQNAYLMLAQLYIQSGKAKDSLQPIDDLLKRNPTNKLALSLSGMVNAQLENYDAAQRAYESALKIDPNFVLVMNNQAYLLAEIRNRLDDAHALANKARQLAPADARVAETLGWIEYRRGNYPESLRLLTEAQAKLPGQPEVDAHLGLIHYMMGNEDAARTALTAAVKDPTKFPVRSVAEKRLEILNLAMNQPGGKAVEFLSKRRQEDPNDLIAALRLAKAHEAAGNLAGARESYEAVVKLNPRVIEGLARLSALEIERDPARATQLARQAQQLAPNDPEVTATLGRLALGAGDYANARGLLQRAVKDLGTRSELWSDLSEAAFGSGLLNESIEAKRTAIGKGLPASRTNAALTFLALLSAAQNPSASTAASGRTLADQVLKVDATNGPALYALGMLTEQQGKFPEARDAHEKLLARYPAFVPSVRQLALLYAERLNNDTKAYELATKARTSLPKDDTLAKTLGGLAFKRNEFRLAAQIFSEVARNQPNDGDLQFRLGVAYLRLKQISDSRAALERAIKLDPKATYVTEARKILADNKAG